MRKLIRQYAIILVATSIFGMGVSLFIDPNSLAPGGISGLSIIISRLLPISTGTLFLIINIPIIIIGYWKFGNKLMISTMLSIVLVSLFTNLFGRLEPMTTNPILAALFGGCFLAVGMGLVLKNGSTTGGTDIIVKCIKQKVPHVKTGTLFLLIDSIIIGLGGFVIKNSEKVLLSILCAIITSAVLDMVLYGKDEAKLIYIISNQYQKITNRIIEEIPAGVTHLSGSGAYRNQKRQIIMCVVKKQNAFKVEEIVKQEDSNAFLIISKATEIYGEGYKDYSDELK